MQGSRPCHDLSCGRHCELCGCGMHEHDGWAKLRLFRGVL